MVLIFLLIPFFVTLLITPKVIHFAKKFNCIDHPCSRRFHSKPTPRWGGIAFFLGFASVFLFLSLDKEIISYIMASLLLVTIGARDDWKHLGWGIKFLGIIAAASIVIFIGEIKLLNLGFYGSFGEIRLGVFSILFTYFCIIGVTNAMNLIDGLNGLSGGIALLGFLFMGIAAYISGNYELVYISAAFVGALSGFLRYNFPRAKIFMGDSGSLFLGFSLAVYAVLLTQNKNYSVNPMLPVVVLFVPIFDTLRVMMVRIFSLKNPFQADTTHLHHLFVKMGFSKKATVFILWGLTVIFGGMSLLIFYRTSTPFLIIALAGALLLSFFSDAFSRGKTRTRNNSD